MAQKTVKKVAAKPAAKKAPVKKAVKKTSVKKAAVKQPQAVVAPEMHACGHECACGHDCACHKRGCSFGRVLKKVVIFLVIFALGFAAAKFCPCNKKPCMRGPRAEFVNGCIDAASIKCPKLVAALPAMDINADGCVTRDEFRAAKKEMRREIREMNVELAQ